MTSRELNLAIFRREPTGGRILWQPRIEHWYETNRRQGTLPERYREFTMLQVFDDLGCSVRPYWAFNDSMHIEDAEQVTREEREDGNLTYVTEHTPVGKLVTILEKTSQSWHTRKFPVVTPDDMKVMEWHLRHRRIWFDHDYYNKACAEIGERAAPCVFISRINLLRIVIEFMGFENGLTAFYNYPDETAHLIHTINETDDAMLDMVCASPLEIINFGDNVHQAFCPPNLFREWVLPEYQRRNARLHAAGKKTYPHWDGDCGQLLPYAQDCGFDGYEAITPVPQGDVTLEQVRDALGDRILLDGIPCTDFLPTESLDSLIANTRKCIEYFAPNLVLGISDEISPVGDIERVRLVSEIVAEHGA
ncbi:MAG: hypothetical protein IT365_08445 [Candidatus Hydrogenedentes bacterium]|nr:hypothetical protein [Candidatus Hydrogenedentota bacterium]